MRSVCDHNSIEFRRHNSEGETPGPIPNPEAKPFSADGTALVTGWESRSPPDILRLCRAMLLHERPSETSGGLSSFLNSRKASVVTPPPPRRGDNPARRTPRDGARQQR